ncbi:MAG: NAD(+) diphosphatase [Aeromicrobium sp.]
MDFAFDHAQHDRAAHLRKGNAWRDLDQGAPAVKVLVIGGEHVPTVGGAGLRWIGIDDAPDGEWIFLGTRGDQRYAAVMVDRLAPELEPVSLRMIGPTIASDDASLAVHAVGIAQWHQTHQFCARCGSPSTIVDGGHVRRCPECGAQHFPRTDPAVIMLITDDQDRVLLGRQSMWPEKRFSTLAGFVEPGETLGDAVRRETMEEVGISVGDVTYAASQPWPFPSSLMLGFNGRALTTDIHVDQDEIAEAHWFSRDEVTELTASGELLLPPDVSISRWLLHTWHQGTIHGRWS